MQKLTISFQYRVRRVREVPRAAIRAMVLLAYPVNIKALLIVTEFWRISSAIIHYAGALL